MDLRLTLLDRHRVGVETDVRVAAAAGTAFTAVADELRAACGAAPAAAFETGGRPVPPDAVLGLPPVLDGAVLSLGSGAPAGRGSPDGLISLDVVAGVGAGARVPLAPGTVTLGRSPGAGVRLDGPDVSKVHASLTLDTGGGSVRDLGSTNGTSVTVAAGEPPVAVGPEPVAVPEGGLIRLGDTVLVLRGPDGAMAVAEPDGEGAMVVSPPPHLAPGWTAPRIEFPERPADRPERWRVPWPALVLPVLVAVPLALLWGSAVILLLALAGPLMSGTQYLLDRRDGGRRHREERARFAETMAGAERSLAETGAAYRRELEVRRPDLAQVSATAAGPGRRLWQFAGAEPQVRLGLGDVAVDVDLLGGGAPAPPVLTEAPFGLGLPPGTVLGLCGPSAGALARSVVGQLAVGHPPSEVHLHLLAEDVRAWAWARWLPHTRPGVPATDGKGPAPVVLVEAGAVRRDPLLARLAERPGRSVLVVLAEDASHLPAGCTATVEPCEGAPGRLVLRRRDLAPVVFAPDLPPAAWAVRIGRALAPLRAGRGGADADRLPSSVRLVDLFDAAGLDATDPADLVRAWSGPGGMRSLLGTGPDGPRTVDLIREGPHVLVGGTTGAGKSELLRTLVTSLAVTHPPERLTFVFVDYKGGAAFAACTRLPHSAGLVTDLDPGRARRALESLSAELRRREHLLGAAGVADLAELPADLAPPRLMIVVDEFRALAQDLPDFVEGLVRVAATGRSLGIHLVLATQRPAGVVSADMRANLGLRIALRMRDGADSTDVVESPEAAAFPPDRPGRAVLRSGEGDLVPFQTAHLSRPAGPATPTVTLLDEPVGPPPVSGEAPVADDDLTQVVAAAVEAARRLDLKPARAPWLPPLPDRLPPDSPRLTRPAVPPGDRVLVLGLTDRPERQEQEPLVWTVRAGRHLAVIGGPGSGRTTAARAVVAAASGAAAAIEIHVLDGSGRRAADRAGADLAGVGPAGAAVEGGAVGSVVPVADVERAGRLLRRLRSGRPAPQLLVVDGWEGLVSAWEPADHGRLVEELLRLLREGAAHGVTAVLTGGRALTAGSVSALVDERLVLSFPDPTDLTVAGVPARRVPDPMPPGRAVHLTPATRAGVVAQISVAPPPTSSAAPGGAGAGAPPSRRSGRRAQPGHVTPPVPAMPRKVHLAALGSPPWLVPWGVGGDDLGVLGLPMPRTTGVLVAGRPGSGRTTALRSLAASCLRRGTPVLVVTDAPAEWTGPVGVVVAGAGGAGAGGAGSGGAGSGGAGSGGAGAVAAELRSWDGAIVVDGRLDPLADAALAERVVEGRGVVAVGADLTEAATAFRGLLAEVRGRRTGLLLGPLGPGDADILGARSSPSSPDAPAGRGLLVLDGRAATFQVALP